jgi:glycosyltransferase involved in cell wall biosynthesis
MNRLQNSIRKKSICIVLTYYYPYTSGLTNVARDVAEGLAARGWHVTVVATRHDKTLPLTELINGVRVLRCPIACRVGKGVVSPSFIATVLRESKKANVVNMHLPMLEAGLVAYFISKPIVTTYQCDVSLPPTLVGRIQNALIDASTRLAAHHSEFVTVSSDDYASHCRVKNSFVGKQIAIAPTCHLRMREEPTFRETQGLHIGFLGRLVEEKGIEYLVRAFRELDDSQARLLIAGDFDNVAGGSVVDRIRGHIAGDTRIRLLGFLPDDELSKFYSSIDVFSLPSVNPFEAFGIVQVEALMLGIPVIASNLPGVRQPVTKTGLGIVVEPRSVEDIKNAFLKIKNMKIDSQRGVEIANSLYSKESILNMFENLFLKFV